MCPAAGREPDLLLRGRRRSQPAQEAALAAIVRIDPIERGKILKRLDGYVTAGYNYTKSNELQQMTFSGGLSAQVRAASWSLDGSSTVTSQEGNEDTSRYSIDGWWRRFLQERWFLQGFGGFESNDELALDLRTMVGGAYGRYLVQTQKPGMGGLRGPRLHPGRLPGRRPAGQRRRRARHAVFLLPVRLPRGIARCELNIYPSLTESGRFAAKG